MQAQEAPICKKQAQPCNAISGAEAGAYLGCQRASTCRAKQVALDDGCAASRHHSSHCRLQGCTTKDISQG